VNAAVSWAAELDASGYTVRLRKRLLVIASEDVGMAAPTLVSTIRDLYELHREMRRRDRVDGRLFVLRATYVLATAPKSRAIVMDRVRAATRTAIRGSTCPTRPSTATIANGTRPASSGRGW